MTVSTSPPPAVWRALGAGASFLLVAGVLAIAAISAGSFDPALPGPLRQEQHLGSVVVANGEKKTAWQNETWLPPPPFSTRLTTTFDAGSPDVAYGLALGSPAHHLTAMLSPAGYATIQVSEDGDETILVPWQTTPHVEPGLATNELQLDVAEERVTVWINRKQLWQGTWTAPDNRLGLVTYSYGGEATLTFESLQLYAP